MNTLLVMTMPNKIYDCHHEELIRQHELEINDLKNELGYKKERLDAMDKKIDKIDKKIDNVANDVNTIMMKSIEGDNDIDKRLTSVETTIRVLKGVVTFLFGSGVIWVLYSFIH